MTKYHATIEGFNGDFNTYADLEAWAVNMKVRYGFSGKKMKVFEKTGNCYRAGHVAVIVL